MDTVKCRAFVVSAETGSFSAAAQLLGYTPSGITRMVEALESELGLTLLKRGRRGVSVTAEGRELLASARACVQAAETLAGKARSLTGLVSGHVRIGTYSSIAAHWLPHVVKRFQEDYPNVTVSVREAGNRELAQMLVDGRVDCCFTSRRLTRGDWVHLAYDPLVAWVPSGWPEACGGAVAIGDFASHPFVMPLPQEDNDVDAMFAEQGVKPDVRFSVRDNYTAWRMVESGLGMSVNNLLMSAGWDGDVRVLPLDPPQTIELGIEVADLELASPAAVKFIEYVKDELPRIR